MFKSPVSGGCIKYTCNVCNQVDKFIGTLLRLHHYPYEDHLISRNTYVFSLSTTANPSIIHSFIMVEYTNTEYTNIVLVYGGAAGNGRAARRIYEERYPRAIPSKTLFAKIIQRLGERGLNRQQGRLWCSKETPHAQLWRGCSARVENTPSTRIQTNARGRISSIVQSGRFCKSSKYTPEDTCNESSQFCTRANFCMRFLHLYLKQPLFQDRYSSPMNVGSLGTLRCFKLTKQPCLKWRKPPCLARLWIPATVRH